MKLKNLTDTQKIEFFQLFEEKNFELICDIFEIHPRTAYRWADKLNEAVPKAKKVESDIISAEAKLLFKQQNEIKALKQSLAEAKRELENSDNISSVLLDVKDFKYRQKPIPDFKKLSSKVNGVPVLMLSDIHYGEKVNPAEVGFVNEYDSIISERRINYTVDETIKIVLNDWTAYKTEWFVLPMIGDMLSGNIHDELAESNDQRILPSVLALADILIYQVEKLAKHFKVYVPCVVGNHARLHRKFRAKGQVQENYEYIIYKMIEKHFIHNDNVVIHVSESPDLRFDVFNKRFLLTHGNTLGGGGGGIAGILPLLYRGNYKKQERAASINNGYDTLLIGHYHQSLFLGKVFCNGTTKGVDEYALNLLNCPFELPSQNLFMVDRKYNDVTYRLPVFCESSQNLECKHTIKTY